ncbi:hypothetical protein OSTOST_18260 [Ostertagia ostertagi]
MLDNHARTPYSINHASFRAHEQFFILSLCESDKIWTTWLTAFVVRSFAQARGMNILSNPTTHKRCICILNGQPMISQATMVCAFLEKHLVTV